MTKANQIRVPPIQRQADKKLASSVFGPGTMSKWITAQELAGLPGVPGTARNVKLMATREGWEGQRRLGSKAIEYHMAVLPPATQKALLQAAVNTVATQTQTVARDAVIASRICKNRPLSATGNLNHRQTLTRDARQLVLNQLNALIESGLSRKAACRELRKIAACGELTNEARLALAIGNSKSGLTWTVRIVDGFPFAEPLPGQDVVAACCKTSIRTLLRWIDTAQTHGEQALAPGKREADMSVKPWVPYLLARMQRPQKPHLSDAWRAMCLELPEGIKVPSYHTAYRWYTTKYSNLDKMRGRNQGSAMNPHKFSLPRTSDGMVPMQEIHSDGWGTHFTAPHPVSGKYVKLEVWHTHDVATRYVFRPSIGLSESMLVILGSLRNAVAFGGVPAVWQTDNTSSVKNDRMSFNPVTSIQARMGISIVHSLPGNSQANGISENFNKYLDRRSRELATYMADSMDSLASKRVLRITQKLVKAESREERRKLKAEAEKVGSGRLVGSFDEACDLINRWCDEFNQTPHSSLPKITDPESGKRRHQTPSEAMATHVANGWKPASVTTDHFNDLFRPHETRSVQRGTVTLYNQSYYNTELEHFNREQVQVAYDLHDGERVWVKTLEGRLICEARIVKARGYRPLSFYEMAMEKRADAAISRHEVHIAEIERQRTVQTLTHESTPILQGFNPVISEQHQSRMVQGELLEAEAVEPTAPARKEPKTTTEWTVPATPDARWPLWVAAHAQRQAGIEIDNPPLLKWLDTYPKTSEYRSFANRSGLL